MIQVDVQLWSQQLIFSNNIETILTDIHRKTRCICLWFYYESVSQFLLLIQYRATYFCFVMANLLYNLSAMGVGNRTYSQAQTFVQRSKMILLHFPCLSLPRSHSSHSFRQRKKKSSFYLCNENLGGHNSKR